MKLRRSEVVSHKPHKLEILGSIPSAATTIPDATFTWLHPCKKCPAHWYPTDPEARDVMEWDRQSAEETIYRCAWRPAGNCMGISWKIYEEFGTKKQEGKW